MRGSPPQERSAAKPASGAAAASRTITARDAATANPRTRRGASCPSPSRACAPSSSQTVGQTSSARTSFLTIWSCLKSGPAATSEITLMSGLPSPWSRPLRSFRSLLRPNSGRMKIDVVVAERGVGLDPVPEAAELLVVAADHLDVAVVGRVRDVVVLQHDAEHLRLEAAEQVARDAQRLRVARAGAGDAARSPG